MFVSGDTHRSVRVAAGGFALATVFTTAVSIRDDLPGQPLGIRVPLSVPTGIVVGWGSGVAAPWPMPVTALIAAARVGGDHQGAGAALVCAGVGIAGIIGLLIEPNTYKASSWTQTNRLAVVAGFVASGSLAAAGLRHWRRIRPARAGRFRR